jgi:hypothetical protein
LHIVCEEPCAPAAQVLGKGTSTGWEGPVQSSVEKTSAVAAVSLMQVTLREAVVPCTVHPTSCATL